MFRAGWTTVITGHTLISRHGPSGMRIYRHAAYGLPRPYHVLTPATQPGRGPVLERYETLEAAQVAVEQIHTEAKAPARSALGA